jgi:SAM-dependent methyltransferase
VDEGRQSGTPSAAECCAADARIAEHFDGRITELTAEAESEFPEMVDVSSMLLGLLDDATDANPTVAEIGCGSGALTVALLKRGATRARGYDLSPGMLAVAVKRAEQADLADRVAFTVGDGATAEVEAADWVVMDRVICCYRDVERLLATATRAATRRVAFTVPSSRGWRGLANKLMWRGANIPVRLGRGGCPGYVHNNDEIEARLAAAGFTKHATDRLGLWYAAVWDRPARGG